MEHFELFDFTIQLTQRVVEEVDFDGSNDSIEGIMSRNYHTSHPTPIFYRTREATPASSAPSSDP